MVGCMGVATVVLDLFLVVLSEVSWELGAWSNTQLSPTLRDSLILAAVGPSTRALGGSCGGWHAGTDR